MPQVPYNPVPQSAQMIGTPKVQVNAPEAAFGGAVGQAVQGLGKGLEHAGDEVFRRAVALQELKNETDARDADAEYMKQSAVMMADFKTRLGNNAGPEALKAHIDGLDKLRQSIRGGLPNDAARKLYDGSSIGFMGREVINASIHAAGQQKEAVKNSIQAELDANNNYVHQNPKDEVALRRAIQNSNRTVRGTLGPMEGWDEKTTDVVAAKTQSKLISSSITGLAKTDPLAAEDMLKKFKPQLYGDDVDKTENYVQNMTHSVGARLLSDRIMSSSNLEAVEGKPADSLESLQKRGDEMLKGMGSEDPLMVSALRNRIHADYIARKQSITDTEYRNMDMIDNAMRKFRPQNIDQMKATSPQMEDMINNLSRPHLDKLERRINAYNASLRKQGNDDEYERFSGMQNSPEGREELLNIRETDLGAAGLNQPQMNKIMALQKQLRKGVEGDPRVNHAISQFRISHAADLEALGVYKRTDKNKEQYDKFSGAMQEAIDTWIDVYKKPPGVKDIQDTIGPQVIRSQVEKHWFGADTRKNPFFSGPMVEKYVDQIKATKAWQELPETEQNDANLRRSYNHHIFQMLFEAGIKKDQGKVPPKKTNY